MDSIIFVQFVLTTDVLLLFSTNISETVEPNFMYVNWVASYAAGCTKGKISSFATQVIRNLAKHHFKTLIRPLCQSSPLKG